MTPLVRPLVARDRRSAELVAALEGTPLTALVAPAGYGKTSLLGLALDAYGKPSARYTAELWQSDDFIGPVVDEVRKFRPDFGRLTQALSRRPRGDAPELERWGRRLGGTFASELDHVREPLVITIEDAHVLAGDPAFSGFIAGVVRALPEDVRLVLTGRSLPALPLAEWIAAGRARLFGVDDLRFEPSEVAALAALSGRELTEDEAAALCSTYEGWAAGLALAFTLGDRALPSEHGSLPARSVYLLEANIATLAADLVDFLEATSVFQTLDAGVLERAPELGDVRRYLRDLEHHGVMLEVIRAGEAYRLHPLLREALLTRVRTRSGAPAIRTANLRAAEALARAGRTMEALFHFEAAEDDARLGEFLLDRAYELFIAGQGERIGRIARRLGREGRGSPVAVAVIEGMLLRQRGDSGASDAFARGLAEAQRTNDEASALKLRLLMTEDKLARREPIGHDVLSDLGMLSRSGSELAEADANIFAGWSAVIEGDFPTARDRSRAALAIVGENVIGATRIASLGAYAATCLGDFEGADRIMLRTLRTLESSDHIVLLANTLVWYARLALLWGDAAAARDYAERGAALAHELDLSAEVAGAELALAEIYAIVGDRERCVETCAAARRSAASAWYAIDRDRTTAMTSGFEARAAFAAGDVERAFALVSSAFEAKPPEAQRAVLAGDAFAYRRLMNRADPRFDFAAVARIIVHAPATDALDATALDTAADILAASMTKGGTARPALHQGVADTYAALLKRRRERHVRVPETQDAIVRALLPGKPAAVQPKHRDLASQLTQREGEILNLLAQGLSNREMAQRLCVSPRTIDTHVERVLSKLDATSRTRAVAIAFRLGLVATP